MKVTPAIEPEHGSLVITRDGVLGLVLGLPRPPGFIPIIPKYILCRRSPWTRTGSSFCRVLKSYGPLGIMDSLKKTGFKEYHDGLYNSPMPYVRSIDVTDAIRPREALQRIIGSPRNSIHYTLLELLELLRREGIEIDNIGLTGSLSIGIENPAISDIDLVAYGSKTSLALNKIFSDKLNPQRTPLDTFGGLKVEPPTDIGWRRAQYKNYMVGWVGIPGLGELCRPIKEYYKIETPMKPHKTILRVEGGQPGALTYPPCVTTTNGTHIISFEYNIGALLYEGGVFNVEGLADPNTNVIYIGTRQLPGSLHRINQRKQ